MSSEPAPRDGDIGGVDMGTIVRRFQEVQRYRWLLARRENDYYKEVRRFCEQATPEQQHSLYLRLGTISKEYDELRYALHKNTPIIV